MNISPILSLMKIIGNLHMRRRPCRTIYVKNLVPFHNTLWAYIPTHLFLGPLVVYLLSWGEIVLQYEIVFFIARPPCYDHNCNSYNFGNIYAKSQNLHPSSYHLLWVPYSKMQFQSIKNQWFPHIQCPITRFKLQCIF